MNNWIDLLERESRSWWAQRRKAFPLALAPAILKSAGIDYKEVLAGRKLREAINAEGVAKLRVIRNPEDELSWAILPSDIPIDGDLTALFSSDEEVKEPQFVRFRRGVWTAFAHPLRPGKRRFILTQDFMGYADVGPDEMPPAQGIEITEADMPEPLLLVAPSRDAEIIKAISAWAKAKNISLASMDQGTQTKNAGAETLATPKKIKLNLSDLSEEDLRRISIPLDLISKIRFE